MEYFFWIVIALILFTVEAITLNLVTIWFALGAVSACLSAIARANVYTQWAFFVSVSAFLIIITKPFADRNLKVKKQATNADRVIGKTGIVTYNILPNKFAGSVMVDGYDWSAISANGEPIYVGETVIIQEIRGARLIVSPYKECKTHTQ